VMGGVHSALRWRRFVILALPSPSSWRCCGGPAASWGRTLREAERGVRSGERERPTFEVSASKLQHRQARHFAHLVISGDDPKYGARRLLISNWSTDAKDGVGL